MTGINDRYDEPPPVRRPSMGDSEVLNLTSLVQINTGPFTDQFGFCYWSSQVIGQGMHFMAGTYVEQGFGHRSEWVFWGPVGSPSGETGEVVFVARDDESSRYYKVSFYGDRLLLASLADCVLRAGLGEGWRHRTLIGPPMKREEDGTPMIVFKLTVPRDQLHSLCLLPAKQFD